MATITERTDSTGATSYRVEVRLKGHPAQRATFTRKTDAKKWAQQTEAAIREGRHFKTIESRRHTLSDLIDRYIRDVLPRPPRKSKRPRSARSIAIIKSQLEWWRGELGAYTLADLTPAKIVEARDKLTRTIKRDGQPMSSSTVVRYMAPLSHAFGIAVREWGWIDDSPMRKVERPTEPDGRVRFLSDEEREALLTACRESRNPWLHTVVVLALSTGMRKGELMGLRWPDVDLPRGRITLRETKNGETRVVPLTGPALALLKEHAKVKRLDTDLVFPGQARPSSPVQPVDLRAAWEAALKRAEIKDFHFHDLRHTTASYLAMNGASLAEIAEVLGHKTLAMVKRYAHLSEAHTASVVERMNARFLA
ncbi:site-specific integrase [Thiorhodococcus mannitoliphagus]|uniref:Site-specific integrase n=1 Tax=Thiorhodococcus mannitoliphagus TaxID=329406 RepID=A0A6P1DVP4_9GAMM|nr:site-specific integrase [Thiorhodococcus mannitoliphagus]NEX19754.1 site-specific integrase [Thiorhodococcus mannitoliphagus]